MPYILRKKTENLTFFKVVKNLIELKDAQRRNFHTMHDLINNRKIVLSIHSKSNENYIFNNRTTQLT